MEVSNLTKLYVLISLHEGKKHGYEIMNEIEDKTGKRPSASQIYPFLRKLKENNLVQVEERGDRGKKVYSLTEEGESYVRTKLGMFSDIISSTIEKDLTVCAHCGCKVYEGGHTEEINRDKLKFCCKHCAEAYRDSMK